MGKGIMNKSRLNSSLDVDINGIRLGRLDRNDVKIVWNEQGNYIYQTDQGGRKRDHVSLTFV